MAVAAEPVDHQIGRATWRVHAAASGRTFIYRPVAERSIALYERLHLLGLPIYPTIQHLGPDTNGAWCVVEEDVVGLSPQDAIVAFELGKRATRKLCGLIALSVWTLHHVVHAVHGDLKPDNVLLDLNTRRCLLVDFEFASILGDSEWVPARGCTPLYAAAEQLLDEPVISMGTDIRALGLMLTELALGAHPFAGDVQDLTSHEAALAVSRWEFVPDTGDRWWRVVGAMTRVDPTRRPTWDVILPALGVSP